MIVVEKTRDIGILKSLGASRTGIMGIFLSYGLSLGLVGADAVQHSERHEAVLRRREWEGKALLLFVSGHQTVKLEPGREKEAYQGR